MPALAYKMVARRNNETIKSERSSAYITLSKARVWVSEGWSVRITDEEGKQFGIAEFENLVSEKLPLPAPTEVVPTQETAIAPDQAIAPDEAMAPAEAVVPDAAIAPDLEEAVTEEASPGADKLATA